jgi:hypothetical protein
MAVTDDEYKIMSPSEHYAAASGLLTRGLDAVTQLHAPDGVPVSALDHVIARAHAHAILASVPQGQYDAWKAAERTPESHPRLAFREIGYDGPACPHGRTPARCAYCNVGTPMLLVCDRCGTGCWWPHRLHGSRCDLTGCAGRLAIPGFCASFSPNSGPPCAVQCSRPDFHAGRHYSEKTGESWNDRS